MSDHRRTISIAALTGAALLLLFVLARFPALVLHADERLLDTLQLRQAAAERPDPGIVLIDIDEASLQRLALMLGNWPWPRAVHAELIEALAAVADKIAVFARAEGLEAHARAALIREGRA